jgi:uncharacterized coiled-coil protein SlyX
LKIMRTSQNGFSALSAVLVILLVLVVAAGTYTWQHNKVNSLNDKISSQNVQISSLNNQVSALGTKLSSACQTNQTSQPANSACTSYAYTSQKGVSVLVFTPAKNATLSSPVAVVGEVPGNWSFEAQFPIQLKDSSGNVIAQSPARLLGNWQTTQQVAFSVQLTYTKAVSGSGTLVLQKDNPSGLDKNSDSVSIPVKF